MAECKAIPYRALVETLDGHTIGSVHGGRIDAQPDVSLKISCCHGDLGPYLQTKLTVLAPVSIGCPENKYHAFSKLYCDCIEGYEITQLTADNIQKVPEFVRKARKFDETALAYGLEGKCGVLKLTIAYAVVDSIHEGLFNNLVFTNYIDLQTDEELGQKPRIQHAINILLALYSQNGTINYYIRNEDTDFEKKMASLWDVMDGEATDGPVINKFYPKASVINTTGKARTPYLQIGQHLPFHERPQITTLRTFSHRNFTDFSTRKGYGAIQSMKYEKQEVQEFNDKLAAMKFLTIPGGGNQKYLGVFYIDSKVDKRLQVNDTVWVSFEKKIKDMMTNAEWKCQVIDVLPWLKSGETACIISRPRKLHPGDATEEQKKIPRDFIKGHLPAGNGEVETEEQLRSELNK